LRKIMKRRIEAWATWKQSNPWFMGIIKNLKIKKRVLENFERFQLH
jgi:hypothetical protein